MVCAAGALAFVLQACGCPHCGQHHPHQQRGGHPGCVQLGDIATCPLPRPAQTHLDRTTFTKHTCACGRDDGTVTRTNSALRTTAAPSTMGMRQRVCWRGSGGLVKPDSTFLRPGETQSENRSFVNFYENTPPEAPVWTPHCGQQPRHPSLVSTHGLYESTKRPHRLKIHLGKCGADADSCTTGTRMTRPGRLLRGSGPTFGLRIADNDGPTNNGLAPTNPSRRLRCGGAAVTTKPSRR